jgi:hypothetical protein
MNSRLARLGLAIAYLDVVGALGGPVRPGLQAPPHAAC